MYYIIVCDDSNMLMYWILKSIKTIRHFGRHVLHRGEIKTKKVVGINSLMGIFKGGQPIKYENIGAILAKYKLLYCTPPSLERTTKNASFSSKDILYLIYLLITKTKTKLVALIWTQSRKVFLCLDCRKQNSRNHMNFMAILERDAGNILRQAPAIYNS